MNKKQIQYLMSLVRPVVYNLYGRQSLKMSAYNILDKREFFPYIANYTLYIPNFIWIQVESKTESYKLKIEEGEVVSITKGSLSI